MAVTGDASPGESQHDRANDRMVDLEQLMIDRRARTHPPKGRL
jgi:hypothetical protein